MLSCTIVQGVEEIQDCSSPVGWETEDAITLERLRVVRADWWAARTTRNSVPVGWETEDAITLERLRDVRADWWAAARHAHVHS